MRAQAVKEEAVVGDDDGAAGEVFDGGFKRLQGFDVEVVGGFVEEEDVAVAAQEFGEVDAVAFAAGEEAFSCWSVPLKLNDPA